MLKCKNGGGVCNYVFAKVVLVLWRHLVAQILPPSTGEPYNNKFLLICLPFLWLNSAGLSLSMFHYFFFVFSTTFLVSLSWFFFPR